MNESSIINKFIALVGNMSLSRVAIFAAVLTAGYYVTFYNTGESVLNSIEAAKMQLGSENTKKIATEKVLKKEQQMKLDVELFAKKFEEIKAKIPIEFTESELRATIDLYASKNNLKTTRSDRKQTQFKNNTKFETNLIDQISLGYELEGSYTNVARFVAEVSSLEKLIKVGDFNLNSNASRMDQKKKIKDLTFKVDIIGFKQSLDSLKDSTKKATP